MEKSDELLKHPQISAFINSHQGASNRIQAASQILAEQKDALAALTKLLPALDEQIINVFFSYKTKDEAVATAIMDLVNNYSAGKLDITYQARFTGEIAGRKWREKIRNAIYDANWFILLMPDPSDELDWPLYETGLFEGQLTSADRLICLYRDEMPSQIEGYHGVDVNDPDEISKFLQMIFLNENPVPGMKPLNPGIAGKITELSQQFARIYSARAPYRQRKTKPKRGKPAQRPISVPTARTYVSGSVFISYRRDDSADIAGRIYDRLIEHFSRDIVFKDVDSIPLGIDFREHLENALSECRVLLAIVGDEWMGSERVGGKRRIDDPLDHLRLEIEVALNRKIPVIPVLVRRASIPAEDQLPPSLRSLAYRNGIQVRPDPDFHGDMDRLIKGIEPHLAR